MSRGSAVASQATAVEKERGCISSRAVDVKHSANGYPLVRVFINLSQLRSNRCEFRIQQSVPKVNLYTTL